MTLQQLKYVIMVASKETISDAAKELFISQPSLTSAIKELESELKIIIFNRTNRGVTLTPKGEEFLGYAQQVIEQTTLIEEKYTGKSAGKHLFCVSAQHYSFVVEAFVDLLKNYGGEEYDFRIRETQTYEIIEDVAKLRSEVGILYLNKFNEAIIQKELHRHELTFHPIFTAKPHVFVSNTNPLSQKTGISLEDLVPYPRLSYEQGEHNSFHFSEEILSTLNSKKDIVVRDRATLFSLLIGLDGYTISSGIISETLDGKNIVAIPLLVDDYMEIGYVTHDRVVQNFLTTKYIEALEKRVREIHNGNIV